MGVHFRGFFYITIVNLENLDMNLLQHQNGTEAANTIGDIFHSKVKL